MFLKDNFKRVAIILLAVMFFSYGTAYFILAKSPNKINVNTIVNELEKLDINFVHISNWSDLSTQNINETKTQSLNNIDNIDINLVSGNILVIPYEGNELKATIKGSVKGNWENDLPRLQLNTSGNTLTVKFDRASGILNSLKIVNSLQLELYIPSNFNNNINIKSVSADIQVSNLDAKIVSIYSTSGDVKLDTISCNTFKFNSISGDLTANNLTSASNVFKTTSGDIDVKSIKGDLTFESISGDMNSIYKEFSNNINIKSTSGDIRLSLPSNSNFYADCFSTSGAISVAFPITVSETSKKNVSGLVGDSTTKNKINISTISGEINIKN